MNDNKFNDAFSDMFGSNTAISMPDQLANLKVGLDVFEKEPYNGPFKELNNVILTPHIGSYAKEARVEMEMQAAKNLIEEI